MLSLFNCWNCARMGFILTPLAVNDAGVGLVGVVERHFPARDAHLGECFYNVKAKLLEGPYGGVGTR